MRCSHSYTLNKNVFSLRLNMSSPTSDVLTADLPTERGNTPQSAECHFSWGAARPQSHEAYSICYICYVANPALVTITT